MTKLTKSMLLLKERNCTASIVLDERTNRRNATEFPLSIRFTIDRKFFYHQVSGMYSPKRFSDICNATKSASENYKEQKMWRDMYEEKYRTLLSTLNKGGMLTYEMVRTAVTTGRTRFDNDEEPTTSFIGIWENVVHELATNDNGARFTTAESYGCALKSFKKIMGENVIKVFNIGVAEIQKWKDGMHNGVKGKDGKLVGKISDTTAGIYLRACRVVWNRCVREGYLTDVPYPFSNKKEKGLVSIPKSAKRKQSYLTVAQMTELYKLFMSKGYPADWDEEYTQKAHQSLGLFLVQYLCNGFNLTDAARLTYDSYYFRNGRKAFRFNRKKTAGRSQDGAEVIIPIIGPLQNILNEIAAEPTRDGYVFPYILKGAASEIERRKQVSQENSNIKDRVRKICLEVLHWDESIAPSGTWCRHSFATNLRNAGVELDYISESMGHSSSEHAITQIYIEHYPLETQMRYNSKLLDLETGKTEKEKILSILSNLSAEELADMLASRTQYTNTNI